MPEHADRKSQALLQGDGFRQHIPGTSPVPFPESGIENPLRDKAHLETAFLTPTLLPSPLSVKLPGIIPISLENTHDRWIRSSICGCIQIPAEKVYQIDLGPIRVKLHIERLIPRIRVFGSPINAVGGRIVQGIDLKRLIPCRATVNERVVFLRHGPWILVKTSGIGSYREFKDNVLPRVIKDGYNCIQIMAIQEHPYYGSFGYHVSSFFAPSSRFGTPEELKELIDAAHQKGIAVIMDIVHSHAVKNEVEGLGNLAGDPNQYFYAGAMHEHPAWDSLCFDYGKDNVIHFLLSNCKYWLDEFHFDGFRFDGVTSMLYYSHGLGQAFTNYGDYFNGGEDDNAICYLTLANKLIHEVNPNAITIAEEVSGMPGLAAKFEDGGFGFNYRMAMNIPDYWIKTIKEQTDEHWKPSSIFWEVKNRRPDEKTISYCESHDQALVGDKTIIFRLIDADMYWHFKKGDENETARRGIALHKMIRLVTLGAINGGYLNFMGNEFGHPEWIDFPREGNGWSYKYARRQWNLVDNKDLCYHWLGDFDRKMLEVVKSQKNFPKTPVQEIWHSDDDQILAFMRGDLVFVFNFSPTRPYPDYGFLVPTGSYDVVLNTDAVEFGGNGLADDSVTHVTNFDPVYVADHKEWLKIYIPARSAVVLKKN